MPRSHTGKGVDLRGACGTAADNRDWNDDWYAPTIAHERRADLNDESDPLKDYSECGRSLVE